jgi:hypothetical protein
MSIEPLLYGYEPAAEILGKVVSAQYLAKHKSQLPHTQIGTKVGFSLEQLQQILAMHAVQPDAAPAPAVVPSVLSELKPRGARRKSA